MPLRHEVRLACTDAASTIAPPAVAAARSTQQLVGATGFEPATPCSQNIRAQFVFSGGVGPSAYGSCHCFELNEALIRGHQPMPGPRVGAWWGPGSSGWTYCAKRCRLRVASLSLASSFSAELAPLCGRCRSMTPRHESRIWL